ncbi:hypothetical protein GIY56_12305 [Paracoccus sp. YIM 132242]|uniref:Glycosyltransferase family 2 protein n=1 Tax=Paracoccus lichenicola TaxID=2665644 RepID=A0A6L6HUT5_9RHOB|nr:polysaccharide pyruvyl transferase family protein [Paracoccus lichenicola]MTE01078.1 hypothetical protein [Paracoccus lichenicola]
MPISTVVTSMKDEAPYVIEWVAYHRALGFDRVVVLANDCTDGTHEMLTRLHEMGAISYYENVVPVGAKPHSRALKIANQAPEVKTADFVMVLDADEFLVVKSPPHTLDVLLDLMDDKAAGMMVIPWRLFGSSHNIEFQDRPVIERFTQSMDAADLPKVGVKTLFRQADNVRLAIHFPKFVKKAGEPVTRSDAAWIDAGGRPLIQQGLTWNGGKQTIHRDHAEVAHFMIKSLDEYLLKIFRGDGLMNSNRHGIDYWRNGDHNQVSDLVVADNVSGFTEERDRLFADPVLSGLHRKAVAARFEKLAGILANPDVQRLRTILKKSTEGGLQPEDVQTSRDLVKQMSPAVSTAKLIDGDIPHSTLVSITDAGLADAGAISWRMFKKARHHGTMFWPEKKFGSRPITRLVEGLKRAQKREASFSLGVRWFNNYARAAAQDSWPLDEEILVVLTRDDDSLIAGFPAHVAASRSKHVERPQGKDRPSLREVLTGTETPAEVEALISDGRLLDPRQRLKAYLKANPDAIVLNLDHPEAVDAALDDLAARAPAGEAAARLLRDSLGMAKDDPSDPKGGKKKGRSAPKEEKRQPAKAEEAAEGTTAAAPARPPRPAAEPMRIGILTLPMNRNYGGNLQAYALMRKLRDMGHHPVLVNRRHGAKDAGPDAGDAARDAETPLFSDRIGLGQNVPNRIFVEKHLTPISRPFDSSAALAAEVDRYDFGAVIVGSDQVWRPKYARSLLGDFFLGFLSDSRKNTRKISYAASFGSEHDEYGPADKAIVAPLLQSFDAVSVREDSAVDLCRDMFGVDARHVLDPTLLLTRDDYSELLSDEQRADKGSYMLAYVLDATPDKVAVIDRISSALAINPRTTGGLPFTADDPLRSKGGDKSVEGWLAAFRNADYVVTDSFHGVAFSLIFNRPFLAYGNAERGLARFQSLLRAVGLEDRLVVASEGSDARALMRPIDWPAVNRRLDALRSRSLRFLADALGGGPEGGGKGGDTPEGHRVRQSEPSPVAAGDAIPVSDSDRHPLDLHCTGCGACVSESGGALRMAWTPDGFLEPRATGGPVPQGAARVCPFNPAPEAAVRDEDAIAGECLPDAGRHDPRIGRFVNTYVGFSKAFRPSSSSGGIATFVFDKLLERGEVDHLFVVRRTPDGQYAYRMFDRSDDILTTSKTRYYPVAMEQLFLTIGGIKGRVAVSGVACFIKAIRLKQHYDPALKDKIPFLAGIICGGLKSRFYTDFLAQAAGVRGSYRDAEYRVKSPASLSSDYSFAATGADGHAGQVRMQKLGDMWGTGLFKSRACDFCTDVMTELADISLGDAWLPEYKQDGMGNSVVVTRSPLADRIIRQGIANGELELKEVSPDIAARTQGGGFNHKQKAVKFRLLSEDLSGDRQTPFVRPRVLTDSSVAEMVVQVLRNRTRARSLRVWRQTRDNRAFMRRMRSCLRALSAATGARKQSAQVDGDAFGVLDRPGQGAARQGAVSAVRAALVLLDRRVADGTLTPAILDRALGRYAPDETRALAQTAD